MQNLAEMCFNQVYPRTKLQKETPGQQVSEQMIDQCIHKHMEAFKIVSKVVREEAKSAWYFK